MGRVANAVSIDLFGLDAPFVWMLVVAVVCTALALAGPIFTVRRWLERFGVWIVAAVAVWITVKVLAGADLGAVWSRPGLGGLPFWLGRRPRDRDAASPWLPLVADYSRFAREPRARVRGHGRRLRARATSGSTCWAPACARGAERARTCSTSAPRSRRAAGGGVVLLALLVGESDNAMANVYSSAVSVQNARPAWSQRALIVAVGAAGLAIAAAIGSDAAATLESFLLLIGSVFVPLFAVFLADWGLRARGRFGEEALLRRATGIRWRAVLPWIVGFLAFQWCAPTTLVGWWTSGLEHVVHGWLGFRSRWSGDSAPRWEHPGFVAAFVVAARRSCARRPGHGPDALGGRRREHQQHDRRLLGGVAERELLARRDERRLPLLHPRPEPCRSASRSRPRGPPRTPSERASDIGPIP